MVLALHANTVGRLSLFDKYIILYL